MIFWPKNNNCEAKQSRSFPRKESLYPIGSIPGASAVSSKSLRYLCSPLHSPAHLSNKVSIAWLSGRLILNTHEFVSIFCCAKVRCNARVVSKKKSRYSTSNSELVSSSINFLIQLKTKEKLH